MVSWEFIDKAGNKDSFHLDNKLVPAIKKIKDKVNKRDFDQVFLVDGGEGSGKSVFAMQLAKACDESFDLSRVCMNGPEFVKAIQTANKGQAIIYDEAYTGLSARGSLSDMNKLIVSMMMEMRAKNLIVIIVLPTFFMLDRYVAVFRSIGLFHVYTNKGVRGYWTYFNSFKKKLLYILGKKEMSYRKPRVHLKGRFYGNYVIDEAEYRAKKDYALKNRESKARDAKIDKYETRSKKMIYLIHKKFIPSNKKIALCFQDFEIDLKATQIAAIMKEMKQKYEKSSPVQIKN